MRSRRFRRRVLAGAAALSLPLAASGLVGASPAQAQACPPPVTGAISSAPATSARTVALTFDDGPGPFTPMILRVLRQNGVRATFFDTGAHDQAFPALTRQIVGDGHLLEDHSWDHLYPAQVSGGWTVPYLVDQISRTASQQSALTGCSYRRQAAGTRSSKSASSAVWTSRTT